jgi:hypothetical protein
VSQLPDNMGRKIDKFFGMQFCKQCDKKIASDMYKREGLCFSCGYDQMQAREEQQRRDAVARAKQQIAATIAPLQAGGLLPPSALLYDPRVDAIDAALIESNYGSIDAAMSTASSISSSNPAAAYVGYELIKAYCQQLGKSEASTAANRAADCLDQVRKAAKGAG